jgi:hypothetical protein
MERESISSRFSPQAIDSVLLLTVDISSEGAITVHWFCAGFSMVDSTPQTKTMMDYLAHAAYPLAIIFIVAHHFLASDSKAASPSRAPIPITHSSVAPHP